MNDYLRSEAELQAPIQDRLIDQLTIMHGCIQLVLLRYPTDVFLSECLGRVLHALDQLTEIALHEVTNIPASNEA
jgi:hypothetical protein